MYYIKTNQVVGVNTNNLRSGKLPNAGIFCQGLLEQYVARTFVSKNFIWIIGTHKYLNIFFQLFQKQNYIQ
jgi:hypothetical protein